MRSENLTDYVTKLVYEDGRVELEVSGSPWELVSARSGRVTLLPTPDLEREEPAPRAVDTERGYLTFSPAGRHGVLWEYRPLDSELTDEVSIFASPGEFEPATFAIRPLVELGTVRFELGDLRSPDGATIPASSVKVCIVEPTVAQIHFEASQSPGNGETVRWVAKWKRPGSMAETAVGRNTQVYLDVYVPAEARPGRYSSRIAIKLQTGKASSFTLGLEVLPLKLSRPMSWGLFAYGSTVIRPEWVKEMRRAGTSSPRKPDDICNRSWTGSLGVGASIRSGLRSWPTRRGGSWPRRRSSVSGSSTKTNDTDRSNTDREMIASEHQVVSSCGIGQLVK